MPKIYIFEEYPPNQEIVAAKDGEKYQQAYDVLEFRFKEKMEKLTQELNEERAARVELLTKDITTRRHLRQIQISLDKIKKL